MFKWFCRLTFWHVAVQNELGGLLLCIAALLVTNFGKQLLLVDTKEGLERVILSLDPTASSPKCRMLLYDHISFLCYSDVRFYSNVVGAFKYYKFATRERVLFYDLVHVVRDDSFPGVKSSCMRLLNVLVNTPDDLDDRVAVRNALLSLGLETIVHEQMDTVDTTLRREFASFLNDMQDDEFAWNNVRLAPSWSTLHANADAVVADDSALSVGGEMVRAFVEYISALREQLELADHEVARLRALLNKMDRKEDTLSANAVTEQIVCDVFAPVAPQRKFGEWKAPVPLPSKPMRMLNWTKIPYSLVQETVWEIVSKQIGAMMTPKDYDALESTFCAPSSGSFDHKSRTRHLTLLSTRRSQAIEIFLRSSQIPMDSIIEIVAQADFGSITLEWVELLMSILGTTEELDAIGAFCNQCTTADMSGVLGQAERFLWAMNSKIPSTRQHVQLIHACIFIPSCARENIPRVDCLSAAITQFRNNKHWRRLLAVILTVGNFVNGLSQGRSNAAGISIHSLQQLCQRRSANQKTRFLTFICKWLVDNEPEVLEVLSELGDVTRDASRISLFTVVDECNRAKEVAGNISTYLECQDGNKPSKVFDTKSIIALQETVGSFDQRVKHCLNQWRLLLRFFAEDPASTPADIFGTISRLFDEMHAEVAFLAGQQHQSQEFPVELNESTQERFNAMRSGVLAEMRRTLRRNNSPGSKNQLALETE